MDKLYDISIDELKQSILERAGYLWDRENIENFDPLVNHFAGACAFEIKEIYDLLNDSENRVIDRLLQILIPQSTLKSRPAFSVAFALPKTSSYSLSIQDHFFKENDGGKTFFTPFYSSTILNGRIRYFISESTITEFTESTLREPAKTLYETSIEDHRGLLSQIHLGIELNGNVGSLNGFSLYIDLVQENQKHEDYKTDKNKLVYALEKAKWMVDGKRVNVQMGFEVGDNLEREIMVGKNAAIVDQLADTANRFFQIKDDVEWDFSRNEIEGNSLTFLPNYVDSQATSIKNKLATSTDKLVWITIKLPYSLKLQDIPGQLKFGMNYFPVVNRKLEINDENYFKPSLQFIRIQPKNHFLGVKRVFNSTNSEEIKYLSASKFYSEDEVCYTIRESGIGRMDKYNTWRRLAFVNQILRKEYKSYEVLQELGGLLDLNEMDLLLQTKLKEKNMDSGTEQVYILLDLSKLEENSARIKVEYWDTLGEKGNNIEGKLQSTSAKIEEESAFLLFATRGGKHKKAITEDHLQDLLFRRGNISSREEVCSFVNQYLKEKRFGELRVEIEDSFENDPRPGFGFGKILQVLIYFPSEYSEEELRKLRSQSLSLEYLINKKSNLIIPVRAKVLEEDK